MPTNQKVYIKVGDIVKIISGFYENLIGEIGKVIKINENDTTIQFG